MSLPFCKYFRSEQGCRFGNKCRYKHSDPSFVSTANRSADRKNWRDHGSVNSDRSDLAVTPQQYFDTPERNGSSVRNTRFAPDSDRPAFTYPAADSHGYPLSFDNSPGTTETQFQDKFQGLRVTKHDEESVESSYQPPSQQRPTRKLCHYFARHGSCCFGSRCRFEHTNPSGYRTPPRFQQDGGGKASASEFRAEQVQASRQLHDKTEEKEGVKDSSYTEREVGSLASSGPGQTGSATFPSAEHQLAESGYLHEGNASRIKQAKSDKICQFYLTGRCWRGNRCKFLHPHNQKPSTRNVGRRVQGKPDREKKFDEDGDDEAKEGSVSPQLPEPEGRTVSAGDHDKPVVKSASGQKPRTPYIPQGVKKYRREEVDDVEACRLRRTEIEQLIKRFPKSKVKVHRDCAEYFQCVISVNPTDPDWPFDVKVFQLQVDIPSDYPFEMLSVSLPEEQDLPETVRRYLEVSIEEWLEDRERQLADSGQLELVFRPFLRWLDRNIEDIVTEGLRQLKREMVAKAAGFEFVSARDLQKQYPRQTADDSDNAEYEDDNDDDDSEEDEESTSGSQDEDSSSEYDDNEEEPLDEEEKGDKEERNKGQKSWLDKVKAMMVEPDRRGTEISLKNLQLKENAATLYFEKICLAIQCGRCKSKFDFIASCGKVNIIQCGQCSQMQVATFRPALVHHMSSVIGYLDLDNCLPFDVILQNCSVVLSCMNCSKETKPGAMLPGQSQEYWCRVCHQKLKVATDGARFTQLEPSKTLQSLQGSVKVVVPTRKRIPKDPAIQEGKPLPNFGTCKHYKKSYRWLRFPCCGKCYPCDICHDSKEDHEMKYANRMICGFCCKEQMYAADKACKGCDMNLTKVHTKHWEGGQGCRDKITMCRNDKHKHRNMTKTVSKHAQKVKEMQSKKKTKLRHT